MTLQTALTGGTHGLLPDTIGQLVVEPVRRASVALAVASTVSTDSHEYRIPIVTGDAGAAWVAEGAEIAADDAAFNELVVVPTKVAGLSIISRELAEDSSPSAQQAVGDGLAQSIATALDAAFFGAVAAPAPSGLGALAGITTVDTGPAITNVDPFAEALSKAERVGATITSFVAHPDTVLGLAKIKRAKDYNEPLLQPDATQPNRRQILGVPLISSPAVAVGDIWALPQSKVFVVMRDGTRLEVDRSRYFESDRIGIKATMRVGFAFPHASAIVKLTHSG